MHSSTNNKSNTSKYKGDTVRKISKSGKGNLIGIDKNVTIDNLDPKTINKEMKKNEKDDNVVEYCYDSKEIDDNNSIINDNDDQKACTGTNQINDDMELYESNLYFLATNSGIEGDEGIVLPSYIQSGREEHESMLNENKYLANHDNLQESINNEDNTGFGSILDTESEDVDIENVFSDLFPENNEIETNKHEHSEMGSVNTNTNDIIDYINHDNSNIKLEKLQVKTNADMVNYDNTFSDIANGEIKYNHTGGKTFNAHMYNTEVGNHKHSNKHFKHQNGEHGNYFSKDNKTLNFQNPDNHNEQFVDSPTIDNLTDNNNNRNNAQSNFYKHSDVRAFETRNSEDIKSSYTNNLIDTRDYSNGSSNDFLKGNNKEHRSNKKDGNCYEHINGSRNGSFSNTNKYVTSKKEDLHDDYPNSKQNGLNTNINEFISKPKEDVKVEHLETNNHFHIKTSKSEMQKIRFENENIYDKTINKSPSRMFSSPAKNSNSEFANYNTKHPNDMYKYNNDNATSMATDREIAKIFSDDSPSNFSMSQFNEHDSDNNINYYNELDMNDEIRKTNSVRASLTNEFMKEDFTNKIESKMHEKHQSSLSEIQDVNQQPIITQSNKFDILKSTSKKEINKGMEQAEIEKIKGIVPVENNNDDDDFDRMFEEEFEAVMKEETPKQTGKKNGKQGLVGEEKHLKSQEISEYIKQRNINNRINTANAFLRVQDKFTRKSNENMLNPNLEITNRETNIANEEIRISYTEDATKNKHMENIRKTNMRRVHEQMNVKPNHGKMIHELKRMQDYITHPTQRSHLYFVQNMNNMQRNSSDQSQYMEASDRGCKQTSNYNAHPTNENKQVYSPRKLSYEKEEVYDAKIRRPAYIENNEYTREMQEKAANVQLYGNSIGYPEKKSNLIQNQIHQTQYRVNNRPNAYGMLRPRQNLNPHENKQNSMNRPTYTHMARRDDPESINNRIAYLNQVKSQMQRNNKQYQFQNIPTVAKRFQTNQNPSAYPNCYPRPKNTSFHQENRSRQQGQVFIAPRQQPHIQPHMYNTTTQSPKKYLKPYPSQNHHLQFYKQNTHPYFERNNSSAHIYTPYMSPNTNNNGVNQNHTNKKIRSLSSQSNETNYTNMHAQQRTHRHVNYNNGYNPTQNSKHIQKSNTSSIYHSKNINPNYTSMYSNNNEYANMQDKNNSNIHMHNVNRDADMSSINHNRMDILRNNNEYKKIIEKKQITPSHLQNSQIREKDMQNQKLFSPSVHTNRRDPLLNFAQKFENVYSNFNSYNNSKKGNDYMDINIHDYDLQPKPRDTMPKKDELQDQAQPSIQNNNVNNTYDTLKNAEIKKRVTSNNLFPHNSSFYTVNQDTKQREEILQRIRELQYTPLQMTIEEMIIVKARINNSKSLFEKLNYLTKPVPISESITKIYNTIYLQKEAFEKDIYFLKTKDIESMVEEINQLEEKKKRENPNEKPLEIEFSQSGFIWTTKKIAKAFDDLKKRKKDGDDGDVNVSDKKDLNDEIEATFDFDVNFDNL